MAIEIVSLVIHKLSELKNEESETYEKVGDEIERVMVELRGMQSILNNAQHQEQSNTVLLLCMVYRVEDAIESFRLVETHLKRKGFVKKHISVITNELKRCLKEGPYTIMTYSQNVGRLKSKMNGLTKEIQEWKDGVPSLAPAPIQLGSHAHDQQSWKEDDVVYNAPKKQDTIFKKDVEKLLKQITSDNKPLQIISVFGDIGIGKSAYVKKVYKNSEVKKKFACRALLTVDTNWSVRDLILAILRQLVTTSMKGMEKVKDEVLIGRVHGFLKDHKYLIVINDMKSDLHLLEKLRDALPDAYNGSRVVITTSDEGATSFADATSRYHFKPLDMEDGFKVFIEKVWGKKAGSPFSGDIMVDLKNKIAEIRGEYSHMGIALLAGLLSTRKMIYQDWLSVFEQHNFAKKSPSFDIISFCYNDLPLHLKPCFLYLGLFPKGFEIPVRRMFRLWLAEGFVKPIQGIILEDMVGAYLEELVQRKMVEISKRRSDESPKKCRMIRSLHDIFRPRAVEIGLFHLHQRSEENSTAAAAAAAEHRLGVRRVVECTNIRDYPTSKAFNQYLQSYISLNNRKKDIRADEVGRFLQRIIGARGFGLLKVLDLEGVDRPQLPENLGNLFHLRYLGLRYTFLKTLPSSLGALLHLETVDIKHTEITSLPSSIWIMKHLRHLCLNGARLDIDVQSMKHVKSMQHTAQSQLQTLWGLFVDEKMARKFGWILSRMTNLRKLDLTRQLSSTINTTITTTTSTTRSHSSFYEEIDLWVSSLSSLRSLRLRSKDTWGQPSELNIKPLSRLENLSQLYLLGHLPNSIDWYQIPPALKVLTLSVSQLNRDPMPTLSKLPSLIDLRLLAASYVGEEIFCPENGFPALRVLKLWMLEELKIWTAHGGTMKNLHTLEIRCCRNLEKFPIALLQIDTFENFILTDMPYSFVSEMRKEKKKHTKIVEKFQS